MLLPDRTNIYRGIVLPAPGSRCENASSAPSAKAHPRRLGMCQGPRYAACVMCKCTRLDDEQDRGNSGKFCLSEQLVNHMSMTFSKVTLL